MTYQLPNLRIAGFVLAVLLSPVAGHAQPAASPMPGTPSAGSSEGAKEMHKPMMGGMDGMRPNPSSGDMDKDFATMMKMHHEQGIKMAKMEIENGKSSEMKSMARKIVAAQEKEIAQFDKWLASHK